MIDPGRTIREARKAAGLTQQDLARRAGTSQATLSAYESGRKQPSLRTFDRLLAAAGGRLTAGLPAPAPPPAALRERARRLEQVLALAEELPVRHARRSRFPRLTP